MQRPILNHRGCRPFSNPTQIVRFELWRCLLVVRISCIVALVATSLTARVAWAQDKSALTPSRLHLPKGPGSLEGVGENVEPNLNMGLASYGVAIDLPQGHGGATPSLHLTYSSGSGNSDVGIGWSLSVPSIERMTSRGLPHYVQSDTIAANGSDELVRVSADGVYRARFEGAFVRYTWIDSAADGRDGHWKAEYPDGRIGYFGATSDGSGVASAVVQATQGTFRWHLVEMVDQLGHRLHYEYGKDGAVSHLTRITYVFDAHGKAKHEIDLSYETRPDQLSDAKAGFELKTTRRLVGIKILTGGAQLRRYVLSYEGTDKSGGLSRLASVQRYGLRDEGPFPVAFTFTYSAGLGTSTPSVVTMNGSLDIDFRSGTADFNDLNGDSLPDVVDTGGAQNRIFLAALDSSNHPQFAAPLTSTVGKATLKSKSVEMLDLDGDGHADMVDTLNGLVFWNKGNGDWSNGDQPSTLSFPDFATDGDLRPLDYDNDRLIDVIHSDASSTWIYANRGHGRFEVVQAGVDAIGAGFTSDGLQIADLNGDGMQDVVRRGSGLVAYRMSLGLGRFSDWIDVTGAPATATDEHWVDLNGDSLADWVSVQGNSVVYALNRNGRELLAPVMLNAKSSLPIPERTSDTSVRFADMNGSGSTDVVWIDASGKVTYLELFPVRPNLLTQVDNGIGKTIALTYGTSTAHMQRDGGPTAWHYRLPHPVITLDSIVVRDALSHTEQQHGFEYSSGYYDGIEKQFRGFEQVEAIASGDDSIDSGSNRYTYDVGATDLYHKGLLLTQVVQSSAAVLLETDNSYDDCTLTGVSKTTPPIRFICHSSSIKILKEGRPQSEWVTTQELYQYDGYGNKTLTSKLGVTAIGGQGCSPCQDPSTYGAPCEISCRGDESYQSTEFVSPDATGGRWILHFPARTRAYGVAGSTGYAEKIYHYDGQPFIGLPQGQLTIGLVSRVEAKVSVDSSKTIDLERSNYDADGALVESWDPNGNRRTFEYDSTNLLLIAENIHFDGAPTPYALRMEAQYDPVLDLVVRSSSWMRVSGGSTTSTPRATAYAYDAFGRLSAIAQPGDTLEAPTEQYSYELSSPVNRIIKRARANKGAAADLQEIQCFDGLGRALQKRVLTESGKYQVSGYKQFNLAGGVWKDYQAYTGSSDNCDTSNPSTLYTEYHYDAAGRGIRVTKADVGIYGSASVVDTEYFPLRTTVHDELDTAPGGADNPGANTPTTTEVDGLGRTVAIERMLQANKPIRTNILYDELGGLAGMIDAAGNRKTELRDLLGRVTSVTDPDSGKSTYTYDAASNVVTTTDARGITVHTDYDAAGRKLAEWQDGNDAATRISYHYDALDGCERCSHLEGLLARITYPLSDDRSQQGEDLFGYDERTQPTYLARNVGGSKFEFATAYDNAGRIVSSTYPAGLNLVFEHDPAGKLKSIGNYVSDITYDERGLLRTLALGNDVVTTYSYDDMGRLVAQDAIDSSGTRVQQLAYTRDRVGNILGVTDGTASDDAPSSNAAYKYDALYRLTEAKLDPLGRQAETLQFAYDDVDNLLSKTSNKGTASRDHVGDYQYGQNGAGPHAVTTAGKTKLGYDAAGNLITRDRDRFEWDFLGRMASAGSSDNPVARFWYGATTERIKKTEQGQTTYYLTPDFEIRDGIATLYIRVSGQRVAKIEVPQPNFLPDLAPVHLNGRTAVPEPDGEITAGDAWMAHAGVASIFQLEPAQSDSVVDELLGASARRLLGLPDSTNTKVTYFHNDHLGTVVAVTDSDGKVVERRAQYPYGLERNDTPPLEIAYSFTGKEHDWSTGLTYFGARYYDARLARWTTADPLFEVFDSAALAHPLQWGSVLNRYSYCDGRPYSAIDTDGQMPQVLIGALIGAAIGGAVYGVQAAISGHFEWRGLAGAVAGGAVTGALAGLTMGGSLIVQAGASGAVGQVAGIVSRAVEGKSASEVFSAREMGRDFVVGAATYGVGRLVAKGVGALRGAISEGAQATERGVVQQAAKGATPKCPGCSNCFVPGTQVLMANGATKPIEEIVAGDLVLSDDPLDGDPPGAERVDEVYHTATYRVFHVRIEGGEVLSTGGHPFWTQRGWVVAEELSTGDRLMDALGNQNPISSIATESRDTPTLNLSVDHHHTYFVVAGTMPILVHNVDPWDVQFSRQVSPGEVFQHGPWAGRTVAEAVTEARNLGRLPSGLEFNASRYVTPEGAEAIAAINNRTLFVAQEAGLPHINPVNDVDSAKAFGAMQKQLSLASKKGGPGVPFLRCR